MEGKTKTFPKGMHSDNDPRYQPEGTYRDATNVKLISEDGDSFTIENVQGNRETLTIPCAPRTYEITLNVDPDNSNTLVAGTAYKWELSYTTYDAGGTSVSNTTVEPIPCSSIFSANADSSAVSAINLNSEYFASEPSITGFLVTLLPPSVIVPVK